MSFIYQSFAAHSFEKLLVYLRMFCMLLCISYPFTSTYAESGLKPVELEKGIFFGLQDWSYEYQETSDISVKTLQDLLKNGLPTDPKKLQTIFHSAAKTHNEPVLALLALTGLKTVSVGSSSGELPMLHFLAMYNFAAALDFILTSSPEIFDVNAPTLEGWTPLHFTAYYKNAAAVQVLLNHEASLNVTTQTTKSTPLHLAAQSGNVKVMELLLAKANTKLLRQKDYLGQAVFQIAALVNPEVYVLFKSKISSKDETSSNIFGWTLEDQSMREPGFMKTLTSGVYNQLKKGKNTLWSWFGKSKKSDDKPIENPDDYVPLVNNSSDEDVEENENEMPVEVDNHSEL